MTNKTRLFLGLLTLPLLVAAKNLDNVSIQGVKGKLLTNITSRLTEFAQIKPLDKESDEGLRLQIEKAMQPYSYFRPQININRQGGSKLQIGIISGPPLLISQLTMQVKGEGAANAEIQKALSELPLQRGKPLNSIKYEKAKQNLLNAAEHQGYMRASFERAEILIDKNAYTSHVFLIFNTGPQFYFGRVEFDPTYISPDLLNRFIPFKYGQPYSTEQVLALNNALSGSGYFGNVAVKPQLHDERNIPVHVHVQRGSRVNYSLGLGYGTNTGVRGRAGLHIIPVNRAGHKFNLVGLGSFNENTIQAQYVIPGTNPLVDQYDVTGSLSNLNYSSSYSNSVLLSFAQRHTLPKFQRILSLNGLYERFNYNNQPKQEKVTPFPKATFTWLNTDNQLFVPNGYNVTVNGLGATRALLSEINFTQVSIDAKAAFTVDPIRTRFYFHGMQGYTQISNINQLPPSLALSLGGADNLKAYGYNSITPGKVLTFGGIEIQKETKDKWYLVGFFDSGDVYKPRIKLIKHDVGIGLMWVSPVGPIKIGIAQAVDSRFNRIDKGPRLVINMGPDI